MQIIGQKSNLEIINNWKELPQFIILQGDKHTGKNHFIMYLCEKFNLKYVKMKNGVNDVREIIKLMSPGSNVLYHFKDFDKASIQAKNALLKITEEPIEGNYIVITGRTQIKTLESRARKIVMQAYSLDEMIPYMQPYYEERNLQEDLYVAGINTPSKIQMYAKYEQIIPLLKFANDIYKNITMLSDDDCIRLVSMFDSKYDEVDAVHLFLDMLIHIIEFNIVNRNINNSYYDILNILIQAKESIERDYTLNRKFIVYRTFNTINLLRG